MTKKDDSPIDFEKSFARLEEILEVMNSGEVGLDKALELYEEANALIKVCGTRLSQAEQRVETLIKERDGQLATDEEGNPTTTPYPPQ